jgi:Fic family protein
MLKPTYILPPLPPSEDLETPAVLRALAHAHRRLAEVKGRGAVIPNQGILIDTLSLQEAKASSEIENIITTQDELFRVDLFGDAPPTAAAKEVTLYRDALRCGYDALRSSGGIISNNTMISMFQMLKGNTGGFRETPGTALRNEATGEIVYVPPQDARAVISHMTELERFINDDSLSPLDPLVKMALIHHQFESIHPFPDGNGRIAVF